MSPHALAQAEERFADLVEHSSDMMIVVDEGGALLYANPATAQMFGIAIEDTLGRFTFDYVHPDDAEQAVAAHMRLLDAPGEPIRQTLRVVSDTGEVRVLETVARNCLDRPGIRGIVVNGRDVTERDKYLAGLESSLDAVTVAIANAVELRDPFTAGHQREVAGMAATIATRLGLPEDEVKGISVAATLHDIGKIALPSEILTAPRRLTTVEFEMVKTHSEAGCHIVADVPFPWPVANMVLQHHERLDGSGYPYGLTGDDILLGSRIIAAADVISAMSAHRPYRPARGLAAALVELEENRGRRFDRDVVGVSLEIFRQALSGPLLPLEPG